MRKTPNDPARTIDGGVPAEPAPPAREPADRVQRQAAALRENLRRRKQQARGRDAEAPKGEPPCR